MYSDEGRTKVERRWDEGQTKVGRMWDKSRNKVRQRGRYDLLTCIPRRHPAWAAKRPDLLPDVS